MQKRCDWKIIVSIVVNFSIVIMEFFSLNHHHVSGDGWELFKMYTQDSNILLFVCSLIYVIGAIIYLAKKKEIPNFLKTLRYISTCCITLTFLLIYIDVFAIEHLENIETLYTIPMLFMHTICPILSIISFLFFEEKFAISYKKTLLALTPTAVYAVTLTILNICKVVEGPYFFFEVYNQSVFKSIMWFVLILTIAYLICLTYKWIYDHKFKPKKKRCVKNY